MPTKSKFKGYDLVKENEGFKVGDYYYPCPLEDINPDTFDIERWYIVRENTGPRFPGQTFRQRHNALNYTIIRKSNSFEGFPRRLALSRVYSRPLPLP